MTEPVKDYITQAGFVEYGADGAILHAGHQGIAFTTDAMACGERILLGGPILAPEAIVAGYFVEVALRQFKAKAECPAVLDRFTLSRLPVPCRVEISTPFTTPTLYDWTDPALTLSFEHPCRYTVRVLSVPYLPGVFEVAVDA
ncbi:hypothetical protein [Methylobacterium sp. WL8]|uniref:hypothetical protein n=1 Tax=Methylobacterium sp. WL8 TaxID=2603899 RepID=UPI0011CC4E70|nr:hypothetical protein [Methylobacterium sp. WL8]TXN78273.1 hypothetical protein FV234_22930 [Methylobacterium sp. WL8]